MEEEYAGVAVGGPVDGTWLVSRSTFYRVAVCAERLGGDVRVIEYRFLKGIERNYWMPVPR